MIKICKFLTALDYYTSIIDDLPEQYKTTDLVLFLQRIKSTCFSALLWTYSGIFSIVDRKLVKILRAAGVFEV
jgi:hypothetical protein